MKPTVCPCTHLSLSLAQNRIDDTWKYKFCAECLGPVHSKAFAASPPSYATALALARKVEDFPTFKALDPERPGSTSNDERLLMKRRTSRVFKHDILLHLHRPFFTVGQNIVASG
jgi:hypothetical protein